MNKQLIKSIIGEKQQQISRTRLIQRNEHFDEQSCYVLIGIRRAGKSYTLFQDMQAKVSAGKAVVDDFLYINFEDERIASIHAEELVLILDAYREMTRSALISILMKFRT